MDIKTCSPNQIVGILKNHLFDILNNEKLNQYKSSIISYFIEKEINGQKLCDANSKTFCRKISTYCNEKKLNAPLKKLYKALKELDSSQIMKMQQTINNNIPENSASQCQYAFVDCKCAIRIKTILDQHHKIIIDKNEKTEIQIQNDVYELINNKSFDGKYSDLQFMNDFYHIKYIHNTSENSHEFDAFYQYLTDSANILKCDMNDCKSVQRHYRTRNQLLSDNAVNNSYSIKILSRCHTYFIHAYETTKLTSDEINYIEQQLDQYKSKQKNAINDDTDEKMNDKTLELTLNIINDKRKKVLSKISLIDNNKYITSVDNDDEKKVENYINYMDAEENEDEHILNLFCTLTQSDRNVAAMFLKETEWNIQFAIDRYYALAGDATKLAKTKTELKYKTRNTNDSMFGAVYNHGVYFWYWEQNDLQPRNAIAIKKIYNNLKEEMLSDNKITNDQWNNLMDECEILKNTDEIRKIVSNGNDENIYGVKLENEFSLQHLCSIKLYTDYSNLCAAFCSVFRVKKLTSNSYETVKSLNRRNSKFANWAKLLIECVQCYGKLLIKNKKKVKYYRG
eukprot:408693_1